MRLGQRKPKRWIPLTRVVNKKYCKTYDVNISVGKWRCPFVVGKHGTREEVMDKFKKYILGKPKLMKDALKLRGLILCCRCKPEACHGDIIAELADTGSIG